MINNDNTDNNDQRFKIPNSIFEDCVIIFTSLKQFSFDTKCKKYNCPFLFLFNYLY